MPQPLPFALRQELVRRHQQGETLGALAESMQIPPATVRNWWQRFRREGEAGLQTRYQRCGPQGPKAGPAVHQAALAMKREHSTWGAGLIRLELQKQFPDQPLPQKRAIERWIRKAGLQPPRAQRPPMERQRGKEPHAVWEIDAKERLRLGDGSATSVLSVTDEASGALLGATPFSPLPLEPGGTRGGAAGPAGAV
jgi:transposase